MRQLHPRRRVLMRAHHPAKNHANAMARRERPITRRSVLGSIAAGVLGAGNLPAAEQKETHSGRRPQGGMSEAGIPGPFPGRVVEIAHAGSVVQDTVQDAATTLMIERGMRELVGNDNAVEAWRRLFATGEVVGIK